jgi:hypothetical protein
MKVLEVGLDPLGDRIGTALMKDPTDELHIDSLFTLLGRMALEAKGLTCSGEPENAALVAGQSTEDGDLQQRLSLREPPSAVKRHDHGDRIGPLLR